jgi:hypothetical protein
MQEQPEAAQAIKLDADQHAGANFHTLTLPAEVMGPDGPPPALFGGTLVVALGISENAVYVGLGAQALDTLKQAIDDSSAGQSASPFRMCVSTTAIAGLVEAAAPGGVPGPGAAVVDAMKQAGTNDHVRLSSKAIPDGVSIRLEVEEGIVQTIAAAVTAMKGAVGAGVGPGAELDESDSPF